MNGQRPPALPILDPEERSIGFLVHGSALIGIFLPLVGHVGGPTLALMLKRHASHAVHTHWIAARSFHLWWGMLMVIAYLLVWHVGVIMLPVALIGVVAWAIQTVIVASGTESGQLISYRWYVDVFTARE